MVNHGVNHNYSWTTLRVYIEQWDIYVLILKYFFWDQRDWKVELGCWTLQLNFVVLKSVLQNISNILINKNWPEECGGSRRGDSEDSWGRRCQLAEKRPCRSAGPCRQSARSCRERAAASWRRTLRKQGKYPLPCRPSCRSCAVLSGKTKHFYKTSNLE